MIYDIVLKAIFAGVSVLTEYLSVHVLTCLIPALFIAGAISVFLKKESVLKYLGPKTKKYISYGVASISGAILTVCSCTVLPLFASIKKKGAGLGPAITFLFSGPAINITAIIYTAQILGFKIGLTRGILAISMSIVIGFIMNLIFQEEVVEKDSTFSDIVSKGGKSQFITLSFFMLLVSILIVNGLSLLPLAKYSIFLILLVLLIILLKWKFSKEELKNWFSETWNITKLIIPYLLIGVFIAGLIGFLLPKEIVQNYLGGNSLLSNLVASVFGAFMYFATLTEVPIVSELMKLGMGNGPALALLLSGPSLSLPSMLVIRKVLGTKKTVSYITLVIIFSTIAGLIYGMFVK